MSEGMDLPTFAKACTQLHDDPAGFIRDQAIGSGLSEVQIMQCMRNASRKCRERSERMCKKMFPGIELFDE